MPSKRSPTIRKDPTQAGKIIDAYERDLMAWASVLTKKSIAIALSHPTDPALVKKEIDQLIDIAVKKAGSKLGDPYIMKSYLQGKLYAEMQLRRVGVIPADNA